MRIAVGSLFQESNRFVAQPTTLETFRRTYVYEGEDMFKLRGTSTEVAGLLSVLEPEGAEIVPLLAAASVSGGPLDSECYDWLRSRIVDALKGAPPVDGVALVLHGSTAAESEDDPEGSLLAAVRGILGAEVPVVSTLDLHAHVTPAMVKHATALVAYKEYPHTDIFATGQVAARLLLATLRGETRPTMALAKAPMVVPAALAQTIGDGPMAKVVARARDLERQPGVLAASACLVHPWNDLPGMGCAGVVVTDDDPDQAMSAAKSIADEFWARRMAFVPDVVSTPAAVEQGRRIEGGPIIFADAADCVGAGASGDTVGLLRELMDLEVTEPTVAMVVDPAAASACLSAGVGSSVEVDLGHRIDPAWGSPIRVRGVVRSVSDGSFVYTGGAYGGVEVSMGDAAVLDVDNFRILVASRPTYDWDDEQYRNAGIDVRAAKFVCVKNFSNYHLAYGAVAKGSFLIDTPGPSATRLGSLPYERVERPIFAIDPDAPERPVNVVKGEAAA